MSKPEKFEIESMASLNLLYGDYVHAIEKIRDRLPESEFEYGIPRAQMVNELKRMEAWILEHRTPNRRARG